ncbi:MAG: alpha/beta hydrolase [Desulfosarcina sp.]|nr:alpha/beta hydrolase [Desulfobacterales bacterium]
MILYLLLGLAIAYLLITLVLTGIVQQYPRRPVVDPPNWGRVDDVRIKTVDGGSLEVWRITPAGPSQGIVLFMHGWGRNRDRMVGRACIFAQWGYTAVIHSARDHGNSSPCRFMNTMKFAEDIEAVLEWIGESVLLYGHSAGSGGAIIVAARNPQKIRLLLLEGCYARTRAALLNLYIWANPVFGRCFGPAILGWMNLFYRGGLHKVDPGRLAREVKMPVMLIQGENDRRFPVAFARQLADCFRPGQAILYIAAGAGHSNSSSAPDYAAAVKGFLDRHADILKKTAKRKST